MFKRFQLLLLVLTLLAGARASADTVVLKSGARYDGARVTSQSRTYVSFRDQNGKPHRIAMRSVESVERTPRSSNDGNPTFGTRPARRAQNSVAAGVTRTLPVGTEVMVRTIDNIDSKNANPGQKFAGSIDKDILDRNGAVAVPRGADAELIIETNTGGGITDASDLLLDVDAITVRGVRYSVATTDIEKRGKEGLGANKRTAKMAGGGALLGTLIGAVAGHGKGAAIGAVVGGAAGAAGEVLTKGKDIRIPAETVLSFRLERDLVLSPSR